MNFKVGDQVRVIQDRSSREFEIIEVLLSEIAFPRFRCVCLTEDNGNTYELKERQIEHTRSHKLGILDVS